MGIFDMQLFFNTLIYFAIFICGFVISIPIGVVNINNSGHCILYTEVDKEGSSVLWKYGPKGNCDFPIYFSVFVGIFYSLGVGIYNAYALYRSTKDGTIGQQMWVMPFILINSVFTVMMLIAACIVSVGFASSCSSIKEFYKTCQGGQNIQITEEISKNKWNTGYFYNLMTVSQLACWISVLLWLVHVASGILRAVRNRRLRTRGQSGVDPSTSDTAKIGNVNPSA